MEKNLFKDLYPKRDPKKLSTLNKINKEIEVKKVIHKNGNVNKFLKYVSFLVDIYS